MRIPKWLAFLAGILVVIGCAAFATYESRHPIEQEIVEYTTTRIEYEDGAIGYCVRAERGWDWKFSCGFDFSGVQK
jgi:hypothetical protein